ncbi:tyrosine-protein phosphatase [Kitasatospora sp. NPDC059811]|uniref:tyrosine-protein phosphatase n=1 Tax=Streptomycetaceae TaxID=2062 RepID=UPI0007AF1238|nr:tyrosine-protein phosphatase [Streptomyces sp. MJM8645]
MSLVNFRDPAALADPAGRWIRPGTLFRSAQPFPAADEAVVAQLREHGITTVVDLRGEPESRPEDWAVAEAAGIAVVPARIEPTNDELAQAMRAMTTAEDLGAFYLLMAESAPQGLAAAVEAAVRPGGVLVHCAAGKDRTGLLTALLLELLGVPAEEIVADYARTNEAIEQIWAGLADRNRAALNEVEAGRMVVPAPLLEAPAGAMSTFLDLVRAKHGGAEGFLTACGVGAETLDAFRAKVAARTAARTEAGTAAGTAARTEAGTAARTAASNTAEVTAC